MKKFCAYCMVLAILAGTGNKAFTQSRSSLAVLVSFDAGLTADKQVTLSWTTQQQVVTDHFDVQKSTDALNWESIASVQSTGVSAKPVTYTVLDKAPIKGCNYYRVRIKSADGSVGYTEVKNLRFNLAGNMNIYPNPCVNTVKISLDELPQGPYWKLLLMSTTGQLMLEKTYSSNATVAILPLGNYPSGAYTVLVADGNRTQTKKLLINHH